MKLLSWNVNGLRALSRGEELSRLLASGYDIICLQETKLGGDQIPLDLKLSDYHVAFNSAEKNGYSGTMILSKEVPLSMVRGMDGFYSDTEGRVITCEFQDIFVVNAYFPNSRRDLSRLDLKKEFFIAVGNYIKSLEERKPVVLCGDFNVAREEIDIARPKDNVNSPGFTQMERDLMANFLQNGYVDTFRYLHPDQVKYSWWSYMHNARSKNIGWRIDYFVISSRLKNGIKSADILNEIMGSDHCPIVLEI